MPRTQEASWKNNKQSQSNSDQFFAFFRSMAIAKSEYQESLDIMLLGRRRGITENGRRGSFPIVSSLSLYRKLYFLFVLNYSCLECKDSAPTNKQKRFYSIALRTDVIFESPTKLFDWWIFAIKIPPPPTPKARTDPARWRVSYPRFRCQNRHSIQSWSSTTKSTVSIF
jgi:hypothetical protein